MLFNSRYRKAIELIRAVEPTENPVSKEFRPFKLVIGSASAVSAIAIGLVFLTPKDALAQMNERLASVRASHTRNFVGETISHEIWQDGFKRRYRFSGTLDRGYDGKLTWAIYPRTRQSSSGYCVLSEEEPFGFGNDGTSLQQVLKQLNSKYVKNLKVTSKRIKRGSETETAVTAEGSWTQSTRKFRFVYTCREPDLPYRADYYAVDAKGLQRTGYMLIDYPQSIDSSVFEFNPPEGLPVLDHKKARETILAGIAGGGQTATAGGETITFLGALQERDGGLYVLWTGGATPHVDCTASILNEQGLGYNGSIFFEEDDRRRPRNFGKKDQPVAGSNKKPSRLGYDRPIQIRPLSWVNGQPVYALHCYRIEPKGPMLPTKLTVRLPICRKGTPRTLRFKPERAMFQSDGVQVGTGEFQVETIPIDFAGSLMRRLDPQALNSWGSAPLNIQSVDKALNDRMRLLMYR